MRFQWLLWLHLVCYAACYTPEPKYKCPPRANLIYPCRCTNSTDDGLFVLCENTNMASLSAALNNLAALGDPIEYIKVSKSNIARIFGPLFAKLPAREMVIEDSPLKTIEDYAFHGMNKTLEKLYLINTNLSNIKPLSFGNLGRLTELHINGHGLQSLAKDLFANQEIANRLEILRITNGPLSDLPIETLQPIRKLKILDLHHNELVSLKRNQFKNLRNVEVLDVSYNKLKKVEAQHISDMTKLGWFNASNNELKELARGTFARNSVLKVLHLDHNSISSLDVNSFRGMRFLRRLYMSDNTIKSIGRGTFGSITRIGTIDLARNALKKIEFQMFTQLNYVEMLNLAENNITVIEKNAFKDIYQAVVNVSHNQLSLVESNAFENCVNITVLDMSHNQLRNFSSKAFDTTTFPNEFQLSYNGFTDMAQIPLHNMTGIKILNVSHNNIERVPKNSFPKLYELHTIDLSHNNISFIANGVFQTLFSVRFLYLGHNNMTEVKSSVFGTLPTLLGMDLSANGLRSIVRGALAKLTSLRTLNLRDNELETVFQIPISLNELDLSGNKLVGFAPNTWPVMNSLIRLDLSNNRLGDGLEGHSFTGLLVLQTLRMNSNGITKAPQQALVGMSTLQYLHLENNNITVLEKNAFGKLPVLFELNLRNNGLTNITQKAFEGLLQLLKLDMSRNQIRHIPTEAFVGLPSLRTLDVSFNRLTKLDNKTNSVFDDLLSLETLNLSHNNISFVTTKSFPSNKWIPYNLKYLDLSYNQIPVLTYDATFGTKKLIRLNMSHNYINEIRKDVLGNLTKLQVLDLSNNDLSNLSEERVFVLPVNLTHLYLQNNHLYRIPFEALRNRSTPMHTFDLRNNSLTEFPPLLVSMMRNQSDVLFAGNQLHCSCVTRPLKHYAMEQTSLSEDLQRVECITPTHLADQLLNDVPDEKLQCIAEETLQHQDDMYAEAADIKYRYVNYNERQQLLSVSWFVASTKDIGDFTIYVRDSMNEIVYQKNAAYYERKSTIAVSELHSPSGKLVNAEICIISNDSEGMLGHWFGAQCRKIPPIRVQRSSAASTLPRWPSLVKSAVCLVLLVVF